MTEELFRERLVELFNEFHKEKESSYVSHIANEVAYEWQSSHDLNDRIDEVRSDYVDDDGCIIIDVWLHNDEEGFSVARIHEDKTVEWINTMYKDCPKIMEVIKEIIES